MSTHEHRPGNSPEVKPEIDTVLDRTPTEPTGEGSPNRPKPSSPHAVASVKAATERAVLRECSARQDNRSGWGAGDSDASTVVSTSNAAIWRCQRKYDDSAEEKQQQQQQQQRGKEGGRSLVGSTGTLTELEGRGHVIGPEPERLSRRDSALAGLEETQPGVAGKKGEVKSSTADRRSSRRTELDSIPIPDRRRRHRHKHLGHEKPVLESAVLQPAKFSKPPTRAQKGKWPAKCECSKCQARGGGRVHFDASAMDKAEEEPGLSHEGFVKKLKENRRRMEAAERGEGCSFWATTGPGGLDMYCNPRPAPRLPVRRQDSVKVMEDERAQKRRDNKRDIGEPTEQNSGTRKPRGSRYSAFPPARQFRSPDPRTENAATPPGEAVPMADQMGGSGRHTVLRTLSRRFKGSRGGRGVLDGV